MLATQSVDFEAIKRTQQQTWASGDYSVIGNRVHFVAEQLVQSAELRAGWRVLDVATGSGNAAIAAARLGTSVVGVDYVPALLTDGRSRAAAEGLDIEFIKGDAEQIPVEMCTFDAVLSVFGAMFAPDHGRAARQIARACRPGGTIALASWTPDSFVADMFGVVSRYVAPPAGVASPMLWGDEEHLRVLFGENVEDMRSTTRTCTFRFTTPQEFVSLFRRYYGPTHRAFGKLDDDGQRALAVELALLAADADVYQDGGSIAIPATYLETVARRV
jgi:ubiquinone/menaquinone biosynthesis C-methylase UbiE